MARRLLAVLAALLLAYGSIPRVSAQATLRAQLILNGSLPLDVQASATLGAVGDSAYTQTREIHGPEGEYHLRLDAVPAGEYVLRVSSRVYSFPDYHVRVHPASTPGTQDGEVEAALWSDALSAPLLGSTLPTPLVLRSHAPLSFSPPPRPFSLLTFLKSNPMFWVLGVGVALAVAMPRIVANLDPELVREVGESQRELHGKMGNLQSFDASSAMSRYLAGSSPSAPSSASPSAAAAAAGPASPAALGVKGGGKARRRK
ncbi:hypothetical protein JCM10207_006937 [Rhodosporidiobolus poonsookiae]